MESENCETWEKYLLIGGTYAAASISAPCQMHFVCGLIILLICLKPGHLSNSVM